MKQFEVSMQLKKGAQSESTVDTRWVLTGEMVDGKKNWKARLVPTGYEDPDFDDRGGGRLSVRQS